MASIQERRSKNGALSYRVQVRRRGHPAVAKTFSRKTHAKAWAHQTETDIRRGLYLKTLEAERHTVGEAVERYKRDVLPDKPKSAKDVERHLNW